MFQHITYQYKLRQLFSKRAKVTNYFLNEYIRAKKHDTDRSDLDSLRHEEISELNIIDYEIEMLTTSYYLSIARYRFIHVPSYEDNKYWTESSLDPNKKVLSNKAISDLRAIIRSNKKDNLGVLSQIITVATGLIGAIIGLLAFVSSK